MAAPADAARRGSLAGRLAAHGRVVRERAGRKARFKAMSWPAGKRVRHRGGASGHGGGRWLALVLALALVLSFPGPAAAVEQKKTQGD